MKKLTLENASNYLPYKLKVLHTEFEMEGSYTQVVTLSTAGEECLTFTDHRWGASDYHYEVESNPEIKFILRPTDLTKPIRLDGKEVIPIVELAKKFHIPSEAAISHYDNIIDAGSYGIQVSCYLDKDRHSYYSVFADKDLVHHNESRVVKWLYANKFDVDGLIDAGLAIDVNTLETNPYE